MFPDTVKEKINVEIESLRQELNTVRSLFDKLKNDIPDSIEIRAAASTIHAFYNGVERIFSIIARDIDNKLPSGERWHMTLLTTMCVQNDYREPVISENTKESLEKYLAFRHYFRHSYGFVLEWEQLKPLSDDLHSTFQKLLDEIVSHC